MRFASKSIRSTGFTLLELLLVMSVLAVLASIAIPQVAWLLGDRRIDRGAKLLREEMMRTRLEAMRSGRVMMMNAALQTSDVRIQPFFSLADSVNAIDQTGSQSALLTGAEQGQMTALVADESQTRQVELPEDVAVSGVAVVSSVRSAEIDQQTQGNQADGYSQSVLFYPDGTTSTAAIQLQHATHGKITVKLRGITGDVTIGELEGPDA